MRWLPVLALLVLSSCYGPILDLREPICFVVHYPDNLNQRLALNGALINGPQDWLKHLPEVPAPVIVDNENKCSNPPIHIYVRDMKDGICGRATAKLDHHDIVISNKYGSNGTDCINSHILAHELGHVLWNYHPKHIDDEKLSIMSSDGEFYVTPRDMEITCEHHTEIRCPHFFWCYDDFMDECRCPSSTPEEGDAMCKSRLNVKQVSSVTTLCDE